MGTEKLDRLVIPELQNGERGAESLFQISPSQTKNFQKSIALKNTSNHIRKPTNDFFIQQKEAASSYSHGDSYGSVSTGNSFCANVPSFVSSALTVDSQGQAGIQTAHSRQNSVANFSAGSKIFTLKESDVFVKSKQPVIVPHVNTFSRKNSIQSESVGIGRQAMVDNCQRSKGSEMSDSGRELSGHFYSV